MLYVKKPEHSYAILQGLILFYLILLVDIGPNNNFNIAWDRFIGVIEGGLIGFVITAFIFPFDPVKFLENKIYVNYEII